MKSGAILDSWGLLMPNYMKKTVLLLIGNS
jgi:hypothetical protein